MADLRRRQTYARGLVHGLLHGFDELLYRITGNFLWQKRPRGLP
jgi:hypothetical protein